MNLESSYQQTLAPADLDLPIPSGAPVPPGQVLTLGTELEDPSPIYFGQHIADLFLPYLTGHSFDRLFFCAEEHVFRLHGRRLFNEARRYFPCHLELLPARRRSCRLRRAGPAVRVIRGPQHFQQVDRDRPGRRRGGQRRRAGGRPDLPRRPLRRGPNDHDAQTDSTLSNKQAVNGRRGKNHFGLYHSPLFIWSDTAYLTTEPAESKRCGIVEGIKNGFIADASFLEYLEEELNPGPAILGRSDTAARPSHHLVQADDSAATPARSVRA